MHGDDLLYHECIFYDCGDPEDPVTLPGALAATAAGIGASIVLAGSMA